MSERIERHNHELYNLDTDLNISFSDFMKFGKFMKMHAKIVGTVLKPDTPQLKKNLSIYPHFMRFGYMFFYRHLTDDEIKNGPCVYESAGDVCSF